LTYLFPLQECKNRNINQVYIFGAGVKGSAFKKWIEFNKDVKFLGFIDNFIEREGVIKPEVLKGIKFDDSTGVVLACDYKLIAEIGWGLYKYGLTHEKIISPQIQTVQYFTPNQGNRWNNYYSDAEMTASSQVNEFFVPLIDNYSISLLDVLDFPCGRGRIAEQIIKRYEGNIDTLTCCDANSDAVRYCKERLSKHSNIFFNTNKVHEWQSYPLEFENSCFSFVYSWDAMVHFSYKWLDFYFNEFHRMLKNGGYVFIHHSNLGAPSVDIGRSKSEAWNLNPHGRTPVSAQDIRFLAIRCGFKVIEQKVINWIIDDLDCLTLLKKEEAKS